MRKPVLIPASLDVGEADRLTHGEWLCRQMAHRDISCIELFRRMSVLGFDGQSPNIVSLWRAGSCRVGLETLPKLLQALGMGEGECRAWVLHFTGGVYPALVPYLLVAA